MTKVYNRQYLNDWMFLGPGRETTVYSLSLVMMDIRNFRKINDAMGSVAGDRILIRVADILQESARGSDSVIRYGGDEFLLIFLNCSKEQVKNRMSIIKERIGQILYGEDRGESVCVDFGIASTEKFVQSPEFLEAMIKEAGELLC